jgi:hypothetical protein
MLAIEVYNEALKVRTIDQFPADHAHTQTELAKAYWTFAFVEDKSGNCRQSIEA